VGNPPSVRVHDLQARQVHRDAGSRQGEPGRGIFHAAETSVERKWLPGAFDTPSNLLAVCDGCYDADRRELTSD
jgi:hypothetical protein